MSQTMKLNVKERNLTASIQQLLKSILALDQVAAILVLQHQETNGTIMPSLISDPAYLDAADPLAPSFPLNTAKLVSKLTRKPGAGTVVAVLRSCEIRAFTELVKLKQGTRDSLVILGIDCPGAYSNTDYVAFAGNEGVSATQRFLDNQLNGQAKNENDPELTAACQICEQPIPGNTDLTVGLYGVEIDRHCLVQAFTARGEELVQHLQLSEIPEPLKRAETVKRLVESRTKKRDQVFEETAASVSTLTGLSNYLAGCTSCYNCRVACPVCYCKECVMLTDVFDHEPFQYLRWADQRGYLKMPADMMFYHLTRFTHMSLSCVGCGQCSNACPNDIPLAELFRTVSHQTQQAFEYEAGNKPDEALPLSLFAEDELQDVVGIKQKGA